MCSKTDEKPTTPSGMIAKKDADEIEAHLVTCPASDAVSIHDSMSVNVIGSLVENFATGLGGNCSTPHERVKSMRTHEHENNTLILAENGLCHRRNRDLSLPSLTGTDDEDEIIINKSSAKRISVMGMSLWSIILLNLVAIIWGTQHAIIKTVVDNSAVDSFTMRRNLSVSKKVRKAQVVHLSQPQHHSTVKRRDHDKDDDSAAYFTLARFSLAALTTLPYTPGIKRHRRNRQGQTTHNDTPSSNAAWKYGVELGIFTFLGYAFQAIGLQTTTASRSGFLLYLNIKLVPFFAFFVFGRRIQRRTWISALVAFGGVASLALDTVNTSEAVNGLTSVTIGDAWSVAAAVASALFILHLETASKAVSNTAQLNAANLWTVAFLSLLWTAWVSFGNVFEHSILSIQELPTAIAQTIQHIFQRTAHTTTSKPLQLVYLSTVTTALANYIQSKAQKEVSAEKASLFYALDPLYGAVFSNILLGETLGMWGWLGASLILCATATNALCDIYAVGSSTDSKQR